MRADVEHRGVAFSREGRLVVEEGSGEDARFMLEAWEDFPERARVLEGATASFGDGPLFEGESTLQRDGNSAFVTCIDSNVVTMYAVVLFVSLSPTPRRRKLQLT